MPIFQHGKNAFLALGFENTVGTTTPSTGNIASTTSVTGAAITASSLLASDSLIATVGSTSYYGAFLLPANNASISPLPALNYPVFTTTAITSGTTTITLGNTLQSSVTAVTGTTQILPMWNLSPYTNDVSLPTAIEAAETTSFNAAGVKSFIVGLKDYTLTFSGHYDGSSTIFGQAGGLDALFQNMITYQNTPGNFISFVYGPSDPGAFVGGSASIKYWGQGVLTKYDLKSSVNGVVTYDAELQVTGVVSRYSI